MRSGKAPRPGSRGSKTASAKAHTTSWNPLQKTAARAVRNSKHPAAKRLREDGEAYRYRLSKILVEDDGAFAARVTGEIPKDDRPGGGFEVIVEGKFSPERSGDPAILKTTKIKVLPPEN